jgi:hypothetical protein
MVKIKVALGGRASNSRVRERSRSGYEGHEI